MTNKKLQNLLKTHPEDIKVGDFVNVRMLITRKNDTDFRAIPMTNPCVHCAVEHVFALDEIAAFSPISSAPKYDPCRLLRKGDKVQVKKRDGRCNGKDGEYLREAFCKVLEDETRNELVRVLHNCTEYRLDPAYLQLVTPVEEQEPYHIQKASEFDAWHICNRNNDVIFHFNPDPCNLRMDMAEVEKLARAECDYLNERFRDLIGKVTPVEKQEPYSVHENTYSKSMEVRRGTPLRVCATYYYGGECPSYTKDAAKEAAEAECARLNAEWRKEKSNR